MATRLALLVLALLAAAARAAPSCKAYVSKGLIRPAVGSLQDVIVVQASPRADAFPVSDASVTLEVAHRRIGALKITLGAQPFTTSAPAAGEHPTITLKTHGLGRRGDNLYRTTFSDQAAAAFPVNASYAPFTGAWRPVQKLAFLTDGDQTTAGAGGSQGLWTLTIADVAPNNTLREIALNGWTLVLCERGAAPATDAPPSGSGTGAGSGSAAAPAPAPAPAPLEPSIIAFDGPARNAPPPSPPTASGGGGATQPTVPKATGSSIFGWQVVNTGSQAQAGGTATDSTTTTAGPATGAGAGGALGLGGLLGQAGGGSVLGQLGGGSLLGQAGGALAQPWQQLLAQRPVLTAMEQQLTAIASGIGGVCDTACQEAKQKLWRAAIFGLYVHAAVEAHHRRASGDAPAPVHTLLEKMREFLPGDIQRLADLQAWLARHREEMRSLGDWVAERLRLPEAASGGDRLAALQEAFSSGGDRLQALMSAFAAAGDGMGRLAAGLASTTGSNFLQLGKELGGDFSQWASALGTNTNGMAALLAQGAGAMQQAVGGAAGRLDQRGEALHSFLSSLNGAGLGEVSQQAMAGMADMASQLAGLFDLGTFSFGDS